MKSNFIPFAVRRKQRWASKACSLQTKEKENNFQNKKEKHFFHRIIQIINFYGKWKK